MKKRERKKEKKNNKTKNVKVKERKFSYTYINRKKINLFLLISKSAFCCTLKSGEDLDMPAG